MIPREFITEYRKSRHYQPDDKVVDIEAGIDSYGGSYMNLVIQDKNNAFWRLPFYYNQSAYESGDEEAIEYDVDTWIESMANATEWAEWYNSVELEELY